MKLNLRSISTLLAATIVPPGVASAAIQFEDVTQGSGVEYVGESYGASWGDQNADYFPDVFVNHHRSRAGLYINQGNGKFVDRRSEVDVWQTFPTADQHGGAWGDYNNDGWQDLLITVGSRDDSQFLVNDGLSLSNRISDFTFDQKSWQGRLPVWFDFTRDGKLDLAMAVHRAKFHIHEQTADDFVRVNAAWGNDCENNDAGQLADITGDGILDWVCMAQALFPQKVYDYTTQPFTDRTSLIPATVNVNDTVFADFNRDLQNDVVIVRGRNTISGSEVTEPNKIESHLVSSEADEKGFQFQTTGDVTITLHWSARNVGNIFIGAAGGHPPSPGAGNPIVITLSSSNPATHGIMPLDSNLAAESIYVGYLPETQTWQFYNVGIVWSYLYAYTASTQPVTNLVNLSLQALDGPFAPAAFYSTAPGQPYVNRTAFAGLNPPISCLAVTAADFDNDMDVDLYFACRNAVTNAPNRLYENNGAGVFTLLGPAAGGQGPTGFGVGLAEMVTSVDYDVDGNMDLFLNNGLGIFPENPNSAGGPDTLLRNLGNGNHSIELELVGTTSNRDGIGAQVIATAGGVSQLRERNGGYHRNAQDHGRIHFGLAGHETVDLQVRWPSGLFQNFDDVAADKLYEITEGGDIVEVDLTPGPPPSPCGLPSFDKATEQGVFIGKDCITNVWKVRVTAGNAGNFTYTGRVTSEQPFTSATPFSFEGGDQLDTSDPNEISFLLGVGGAGQDGFDFTFPDTSDVCFTLDAPAGAMILSGSDRTPVTSPFDVVTFGDCDSAPPEIPEITIDSISVSESTGSGSFTVSLSAPTSQTVMVNYASANGSATSPGDYAAVSGMLTFNPGVTTRPIPVTVIDDGLAEGDETFTISLSNPVGATLGSPSTGTGTITGSLASPCGLPNYNKATEQAVFIGKDCATDEWEVRMTAGGGNVNFGGSVVSSQPFLTVEGFSIEGNDTFIVDPAEITFGLGASGAGQDGFDFEYPTGASVCFGLDAPPGATIFVGADRTPVTAPFDLNTLGPCTNVVPQLTISDLMIQEPDLTGSFIVSLSGASVDTVTVDYASANGSATAPGDYAAVMGTLTFNPGATSQPLAVEVVNDSEAEDAETFTVSLSNPVNATLGSPSTGTATITDDAPSTCGVPNFNKNTERGVFIGQDCANDIWQVHVTAAGANISYRGSVVADQPFTMVGPDSVEGGDTLDWTTDPNVISYILNVGNVGRDGFNFAYPAGADVCFGLDMPPGALVQVGADRTSVTVPFDLETLGACQ